MTSHRGTKNSPSKIFLNKRKLHNIKQNVRNPETGQLQPLSRNKQRKPPQKPTARFRRFLGTTPLPILSHQMLHLTYLPVFAAFPPPCPFQPHTHNTLCTRAGRRRSTISPKRRRNHS